MERIYFLYFEKLSKSKICAYRLNSNKLKAVNQETAGKLWLKKEWAPHYLKLIYGLYEDKIVNTYLDGELTQHLPKIDSTKILNTIFVEFPI